jgi:hypothetical protein
MTCNYCSSIAHTSRAAGLKSRTRPVKAVAAEISINRKLWSLAEQVAEGT